VANISINKKDQLIMSLTHYFITKENYEPVLVHGVKDEIWLQNLDGPYKVIRINSNYVHNNEQFEFDMLKVENVLSQIKKKTLSLKMNVLNIYTNSADRVDLDYKKSFKNINIKEISDLKTNKDIQEAFPGLEDKLIKKDSGLDLIYNVTNEINIKTAEDNKEFEEVFKPKKLVMTYLMMGICAIVFLATLFASKNIYPSESALKFFGACDATLVKNGEIWRLLTYAFLHGSIWHFVINMYSLYTIGKEVETFIGKWKFLSVYLVSAIAGGLMSIIFGAEISVGASGAIFGLLGSLLYFGLHYRIYLGNVVRTQIIPLIIINLLIGILPGVSFGGHLGGLVGGYLCVTALGVKYKTSKLEMLNGCIVLILYVAILSYVVFLVK